MFVCALSRQSKIFVTITFFYLYNSKKTMFIPQRPSADQSRTGGDVMQTLAADWLRAMLNEVDCEHGSAMFDVLCVPHNSSEAHIQDCNANNTISVPFHP